ncbi:hypothetical protein [Sorangium sp. So ce385]|uniref:hypothetical protein n=1 Tax=Sorangium sp. So ce385 TaxID=3133308 RepID=UPI003F5B02B2
MSERVLLARRASRARVGARRARCGAALCAAALSSFVLGCEGLGSGRARDPNYRPDLGQCAEACGRNVSCMNQCQTSPPRR